MTDTDIEVRTAAADGWSIGGLLRPAAANGPGPGALLVPGSRHERDAYTSVAAALAGAGITSLRIDIRGRGSSLGAPARRYAQMAPGERRRVRLDVAAALDLLDGDRLAIVAEQDTAADAVAAAMDDARVQAVVLLSARPGAAPTRTLPVLGLVSVEDRPGLRGTVDAYLAGAERSSRLEVFRGLGFGTTMLSTRQFEHPDAEPIESIIARWLVDP